MSYPLDLIVGVFCVVASVPLLMQLRNFTRYTRFIDRDGKAVDVATMLRDDVDEDGAVTVALDFTALEGLQQEIVSFPGRDVPPPDGIGWRRDDDGDKTLRHYVDAAYGAILVVAAVALIFTPAAPTLYLAWALFAGAGLMLAFDLPHSIGVVGGQTTHPLNFIHALFAATGFAAGVRLF